MKKEMDPRMHTAEHILNQTMVRMFDCGRALSAHIEKKKSKCDYHFHRPLTDEEIRKIQQRVNAVITADLPVTDFYLDREEAAKTFDLGRLPEAAGESIRIVKVGEYDACPCIGPHVESTSEIGAFRIVSTSHHDGVLRVRFKLSKPAAGV
ncbi:MAG: hypothetical protein JRH13_15530 [Deltaproteobacteria bacterium]|nr:hypothetical protein [Deltaproteobacteria bacterium]MBW2017982.1 hypothetical protein [Deltaproteobacteria bacterium]MBW2130760.1 hypothetical protein [Deltaproteobacteria bacterium]MBW2302616.1 hypothetical protein [Deltaproteobacteria bacterium]